jgi:hypothetical protein
MAALGEAGRDDPDGSISTTQIEDRLARSQLDRLEQQLGPSVELGTGEHAGIRPKDERMVSHADLDLGRSARRRRPCFEVLLVHSQKENPEAGLRPPLTSVPGLA